MFCFFKWTFLRCVSSRKRWRIFDSPKRTFCVIFFLYRVLIQLLLFFLSIYNSILDEANNVCFSSPFFHNNTNAINSSRMDNHHDVEFHRMLEPDVTIRDAESDDDGMDAQKTFITQQDSDSQPVKPDISIIPVHEKRPPIKIRLFKKEYSPSKEDSMKKVRSRSPRTQVRLVSKDEIERAVDTYQRRKSLPLEKCPICKKYFRRMKTHLMKHEQQQLLQHQQSLNHNINDPLTCNYCLKTFNTQSNLLIHMRTHTGDKPYVCDVCQKGFAQSCNLVNHMRIHTGERPFKCPHCERAFTQSGNLNNHIRLHTDEKPFKCHFCDKAFVQSGNLNSHIKNNHKYVNEYDNQPLDGFKC